MSTPLRVCDRRRFCGRCRAARAGAPAWWLWPVYECVKTTADLQAALARQTWALLVSDHSVLQFDSLATLNVVKASGADISFIIVSGTIGEERAV
jgi:hypothetical protein